MFLRVCHAPLISLENMMVKMEALDDDDDGNDGSGGSTMGLGDKSP